MELGRSKLSRRLIATTLACHLVALAETPKSTKNGAPSEWLADYSALKAELERSYSHLAWVGAPESGVNLPVLDHKALLALQGSKTIEDARAAVLAFIAGFHDGHLQAEQVQPPVISNEPPEPTNPPTAVAACAAYGYEARTSVQFSVPFESLPGFTLLTDGMVDAFRSGIFETQRARLGVLRIPRFRSKEYPALCRGLWSDLNGRGVPPTARAIAATIDELWLHTLADRISLLRSEHVSALVVDVGGNGGGNDLGDWAVRLFTDKAVKSAPLLLSGSDVAVPYFEEQLRLLKAALATANPGSPTAQALTEAASAFEARKRAALGPVCSMGWVWKERHPWGTSACQRLIDAGFASGHLPYAEPGQFETRAARALYWASIADPFRGAWHGPTFVITDAGTGSAAEGFAALMRDSGIAKTVGHRTWGDGCGFMDAGKPLILTHLQLSISIPNCVRLRADKSDEVAGVTPDIQISTEAGESPRARANRILSAILSRI